MTAGSYLAVEMKPFYRSVYLILSGFTVLMPASAQNTDSVLLISNAAHAIHVSYPVGWLSKFRVKYEHMFHPKHSVALSYAQNFGISMAEGYQTHAEYRRYLKDLETSERRIITSGGEPQFVKYRKHNDLYLYGKSGYGYIKRAGALGTGIRDADYMLAGIGIGSKVGFFRSRSMALRAFFLDCNVGYKYVHLLRAGNNGSSDAFFIYGPGAFVDFNVHMGWQW